MISIYSKQEIVIKRHRDGESQRSIARTLQMSPKKSEVNRTILF